MATVEGFVEVIVDETEPSSEPNPSLLWIMGSELATRLSTGPPISSPEVGKVLLAIDRLCSPKQPPSVQVAGYGLIKALCGCQQSSPRIANAVLSPLERRKVWDALRSAGHEWNHETGEERVDALEALLEIDSPASEDNDIVANVEGLNGVLEEIRQWMSSAVEAIFHPQDKPQDAPDPYSEEKEAFVTRLDKALLQVTTSNLGLLTNKQIRSTIELYGTWSDRAVKDEFSCLQPMAPVVSQTVRTRFRGRQSISMAPATFTFPSSVVTPAEATLSLSRAQTTGNVLPSSRSMGASPPIYSFFSFLFLNLIQRFHTNGVFIPADTFPRMISSICYLISLTIKVLPSSGMWVAGISPGPNPLDRDRDSNESTNNSNPFNYYTSALAASRGNLRTPNSQYLVASGYDEGYSEGALWPDEGKVKELATSAKVLVDTLLNDQWYSSSSLAAIKQLLLPPSSKPTTPAFNYTASPYTAQGAARVLRYSIIKALKTELARAELNDMVANNYTMVGVPALLDENSRFEMSWSRGYGVRTMRFEKVGSGLKDAVAAWRQKGIDAGDANGLGGETMLMECSGLIMDVLALCPNGVVDEVPRFAGSLLEELAEVVKEYRYALRL